MSDIRKILVTTDFSDESLPAIEKARSLAGPLGAEVMLLYVVEDRLPPIIPFANEDDRKAMLENHRRRAAEKLEEYAARHFEGCRVESRVEIGMATKEIVRCGQEAQADLIVMASHGYGPVRQLLLGSTTERVLHHTNCPVLVIPSRAS